MTVVPVPADELIDQLGVDQHRTLAHPVESASVLGAAVRGRRR